MVGKRQFIVVRDVGPRDGLQSIQTVMATTAKLDWIASMVQAGMKELEIASFVPPARMPQMADAEIVTKSVLAAFPKLRSVVLAPNQRGVERAVETGARIVMIPVSASEAHSRSNVRKSRTEQVQGVAEIVKWVRESGKSVEIEVGLATAFGCSFQGEVPEDEVFKLAADVAAAGADRIALADTLGYANPSKVKRLVRGVIKEVGSSRLGNLHLHDTLGSAIANAMAGLEAGVAGFDASLGGLGGCPFAPGSVGNVVTEDLVYLLEEEGFDTGIDLALLLKAREKLQEGLPSERLHGRVAAAGIPKTYYDRKAASRSVGASK